MGPYKSLCVLKDSNGSLWVPIIPFASLWILMSIMGPYRSLFVLTDFKGSIWVLKCPYLSLSILMGPYGSL